MKRKSTDPRQRLLIFDCDGVLVDTEPISNRVLAAAITRAGVPMDANEVEVAFEGMRLADIQGEVEKALGRRVPEDWLAEFEADREAAFREGLSPVPGIIEFVEKAGAAGIPLCVASQARREKTELTLDLTGLARFFPTAALFSSTMVERGKPYPDLFLHAAATMGFDPAACVVVEDGVPGVTAARRAGMRALGYGAGEKAERLAAAGAEVFGSMSDLPTLLNLDGECPELDSNQRPIP